MTTTSPTIRHHALTPALVIDLYGYMSGVYHSKVVPKGTSGAMKAAGWALDLMGIQDAQTFATRYTTTIGRTIYLPYALGETQDSAVLAKQIGTCVHEHQHVEQYDNGGWRWQWAYLTDPSARARYEAEAYATDIEMAFWYNGARLDPYALAAKLKAYGCGAGDVAVAARILAASASIAWRGGVAHTPSRRAIAWLETHAPTVRLSAAAWEPIGMSPA
jgi:hypothetical protein